MDTPDSSTRPNHYENHHHNNKKSRSTTITQKIVVTVTNVCEVYRSFTLKRNQNKQPRDKVIASSAIRRFAQDEHTHTHRTPFPADKRKERVWVCLSAHPHNVLSRACVATNLRSATPATQTTRTRDNWMREAVVSALIRSA